MQRIASPTSVLDAFAKPALDVILLPGAWPTELYAGLSRFPGFFGLMLAGAPKTGMILMMFNVSLTTRGQCTFKFYKPDTFYYSFQPGENAPMI